MKKIVIGAILAASTALATQAVAADLGRRAPVYKAPPMAPIFSWTGFYAGVNAGYSFGDRDDVRTTGQSATNINNVTDGARPASVRLDRDGFIGGGQIGYNYQFSPSWVLGIEADIQYTDIRDTRNVITTLAALGPNGTPAGVRSNLFTNELEYLGTVRGRLGYTFDRTMIYATGGLAYGEVRNSALFLGPVAGGSLSQFAGGRSRLETGYTVGGGIEHFFTPNWSVKGEYLYYDLGRNTINVAQIPGNGGAPTGYNSRFENEGHIVRAGLNYKFGAY